MDNPVTALLLKISVDCEVGKITDGQVSQMIETAEIDERDRIILRRWNEHHPIRRIALENRTAAINLAGDVRLATILFGELLDLIPENVHHPAIDYARVFIADHT